MCKCSTVLFKVTGNAQHAAENTSHGISGKMIPLVAILASTAQWKKIPLRNYLSIRTADFILWKSVMFLTQDLRRGASVSLGVQAAGQLFPLGTAAGHCHPFCPGSSLLWEMSDLFLHPAPAWLGGSTWSLPCQPRSHPFNPQVPSQGSFLLFNNFLLYSNPFIPNCIWYEIDNYRIASKCKTSCR